jgi:microcystin-dependent protein
MTAVQRVQVDVSFTYPQTIYVATSSGGAVTDAVTIYSPVVGVAITITDRDSGNSPTVYAASTGTSTIGSLVTDSGGNVPGWVIEGSYTITAAAAGSFVGASVGWEAVRGDGVENIYAGAVTMADLATAVVSQLVPVGSVLDYAGSIAPTNYLLSDGSSLSTATYATLFGVIGYTYGGSGSNFALPNIQSAVTVGAGQGSGLSVRTLGSEGGAEQVALGAANNAPHAHGVSDPTHAHGVADGGHVHTYGYPITVNEIAGGNSTVTGTGGSYDVNPHTANVGIYGAYTNVSIQSQGGGVPFEVMQPFVVVNKIIKYQ